MTASTPSLPVAPRLRTLSLCVLLAVHGMAIAQATAAATDAELGALPVVRIQGRAQSEASEGTGAYTTPKARTATPLGLSARETPQSISVVTIQRIEDQGLQTVNDVVNNVTGLSVHQYETSRAQFTARGFDINALLIDGVPTTWDQAWSSGEIFSSLAIYDRVEVVRGATGLTIGAGDPSAAVNMVRKRATSRQLTGSAELGLSHWNGRRAVLDVSTPLNADDTVRGRVVGEVSAGNSQAGLLKRDSKTLFATIEADLTPDTLLSAGISRQDNQPQGSMWGGLPVWYADGSRTNWDRSKTTAANWVRWDSTYDNAFVKLEHKLGADWKLSASYAHGDRKADSWLLYLFGAPDRTTGLGMGTFPGSYHVRTKQDDYGLQLDGSYALFGRKHELAFGYAGSRQKFQSDARNASGTAAMTNFNNWDGSFPEPTWSALTYYGKSRTTQQAVYAATRLNLADPLKLILGARVSNYEKSGDDIYSTPYAMKFSREVTPYAGLVVDLGADYSAYASYTDIFQPQAVRDASGRTLDPILGKAMEAGIKGAFLGGKLNASAAVFRIRQDNLGQSTGVNFPNSQEFIYAATQGATSKGFELELSGELAPGWNLNAGYSQFKLSDASGGDVNTIYPHKLVRLFTTYRLPGALAGLTVGGGLNWESETYTIAANPLQVQQRIQQDSFALVNLMARYEFTNQLSAQLNVSNAADKTYFRMFDAYDQMTYGDGRNVSLALRYNF